MSDDKIINYYAVEFGLGPKLASRRMTGPYRGYKEASNQAKELKTCGYETRIVTSPYAPRH